MGRGGTAGWRLLAWRRPPPYLAEGERTRTQNVWRGCSAESRRWSPTTKRQLAGEADDDLIIIGCLSQLSNFLLNYYFIVTNCHSSNLWEHKRDRRNGSLHHLQTVRGQRHLWHEVPNLNSLLNNCAITNCSVNSNTKIYKNIYNISKKQIIIIHNSSSLNIFRHL